MKDQPDSAASSLKKLGPVRRKAINTSQEQLIQTRPLADAPGFPLVVEPTVEGLDLITWAGNNRDFTETHLPRHGALLFRNFNAPDIDQFNQFITATSREPMDYHEGASPRTQISGNIYTSTEYPADQPIFLHNELSYRHTFPLKIFFCCMTPATENGATPIADVRKIYQRIDPAVRERFAKKGWMLVRNFGDGFGLSWQKVFHTTDQADVAEYCRASGIEFEWKDNNRLRIRQVRPCVAEHPTTHEPVWFNHVTFFHVSTLPAIMRDELLAQFDEDDLPTNTYYGDGSAIEPAVLDEIRAAYDQETVRFPWQRGDLLMLDNMLAAHGREPFRGSRRIVVGMSDPTRWADL